MREATFGARVRLVPTGKKLRPSADRILQAAEQVFATTGYGEATLRQLMSAAHVSTTAFYARFSSKEEVLRALALRLLEELETTAREELAKAEGVEDGWRRGVDVLYDVLSPRRQLVRILLTEASASPDVTKAVGGLYAGLASFLSLRFESLSRYGEVAPADVTGLAWGVVGALQMQVLRWAVYDQLATSELRDALHAAASAFLPAVQGATAAPPGARKRRPPRAAT